MHELTLDQKIKIMELAAHALTSNGAKPAPDTALLIARAYDLLLNHILKNPPNTQSHSIVN